MLLCQPETLLERGPCALGIPLQKAHLSDALQRHDDVPLVVQFTGKCQAFFVQPDRALVVALILRNQSQVGERLRDMRCIAVLTRQDKTLFEDLRRARVITLCERNVSQAVEREGDSPGIVMFPRES